MTPKGTPGDRSMLLRPCILQYIINFPGSRPNQGEPPFHASAPVSGQTGFVQASFSALLGQGRFFKGKGLLPTAHRALSRQRLRSGFVFFSTGSFWLRSHSEAYFAPTYGRHITELIDRQFMHPAIYREREI